MLARVKDLFSTLAIYGAGDVAIQIVSLLLLNVYTRYLTPADYGAITLLLMVETITKVVFRWGIDASFMRFYYDCETQADRQRLASTVFWLLFAVNGVLLALALAAVPALARSLFGSRDHGLALSLVLINTFIGGFFFIPFHVLRIQKQPQRFIALTFTRALATLVLRLALVIGLRMGVLGLWAADVVVSVAFCGLLMPWFAPLVRPVFSRTVLRQTVRFGLPRLPHALAQQVMSVGDKAVLNRFVSQSELGLYGLGSSIAMGLKLFMSAFEYAWAPFYFGTMKEPDAPRTFSAMTTYAFAVLVLLAAGLSAVAYDAVRLILAPAFVGAHRVVPWIALGIVFQGIYLLTSIGLNITKRTTYYPIATAIAAATSLAGNVLLAPRYGISGAAWAFVAANAVLAGVAMRFSQRFYPIRYEWRRIASIAVAGTAALLAAAMLVPASLSPAPGLLVRGVIVLVTFPAALGATGFLHANEIDALRRLTRRLRAPAAAAPAAAAHTVEMAGEIVESDLAVETDLDTAGAKKGAPS